MIPVSVVIITLNEAKTIVNCIERAIDFSDDVIVVDSGSSDDTVKIARSIGARVIEKRWESYGSNKNAGNVAAKYDWILSLDADEYPDDVLVKSLQQLDFKNRYVAYDISFQLYFKEKPIHFGSWGFDHHVRLFNRKLVKWSDAPVHEDVILPNNVCRRKLDGHIHHYSVSSIDEFHDKTTKYAELSALKYFKNGKKATFHKLYLSPLFNFFKNYILRFGFLDGYEGWIIAKTSVWYTWYKYHCLGTYTMQHSVSKYKPLKQL